MPAETTADREPLSKLLYQGTTEAHQAAEQTPYMLAMFQGKLPKEDYSRWLVRFHFVYSALEETAEALRGDPAVGGLYLPELNRTEAIERDLAYFYGTDWRAELTPSPGTDAYVARLRHVREEWPLGLVPHHWIRYAGYLHGGATLAKMLTTTYGLPEGEGMRFYDFAGIPDRTAFIGDYHTRMNAVPVKAEDVDALVAEGTRAFEANTAITTELGAESGLS
ncbi:heme oxygenase (biliverdin-producing) [Actinomadura sp. BRA 177]|uniref:biliverdin-producing heme oxygenase n=1 Tax=Actinomadura sp. BRA 177 TaxID=2745202 RepID=UPI0015950626|nr:biliverdin-producing heme oxygenase [Actinomadura sp. BRA 177]NVI92790.1 biliverdin-producing heme oxygenase [Actinomadura sp. BRA 177]